jgi:HrpA-like RNA helicase
MMEHTLPEMVRTSLEDLVLTVLVLELGQPDEFLAKGR